METAGKNVDNDELRELMKENGIGRPSTRANIIETLFRRNYIKKDRKRITATITGIELIETIKNDLLKSAELTGMWEKKLRLIELGKYDVNDFMQELKSMVSGVVNEVKMSNSKAISIVQDKAANKVTEKKESSSIKEKEVFVCPKCKKGQIIKGKAAWGCNNFKNGCDFRVPFEIKGKKITQKNISQICDKGKTAVIKGFIDKHGVIFDGVLFLNENNELTLLNQ